MSDTEHRKLREWVRELRPNAIWFLLTLIGSALAAEIVSWVPYPSVKTMVIGTGLCANALLIAWLSWVRDRDNKATTRELTILLQRIEKLQTFTIQHMKKPPKSTKPMAIHPQWRPAPQPVEIRRVLPGRDLGRVEEK